MRPQFTLNSIVTFLAVARGGSFRAASAQLHTSQSAVSARIKQLEERLGVRLFDRTTRSVKLTGPGERLLAAAAPACAELSNIEQVFRHEAALQRGEVTLAAMPSLAQAEMPALLAAFRRLYPGVRLQLLDIDTSQSLQMLSHGDLDIAIVSDAAGREGILFEPLYWDKCCLVVPLGHRLAKSAKVSLRELDAEPLIVSSQGTTMRQVQDVAFRQAGLELRPAQQTSNMPTLVSMVQAGFGVGIAPAKAMLTTNPRNCALVSIVEPLGRMVGIARMAGRAQSAASSALFDYLLSHYAGASADGAIDIKAGMNASKH